MRLLSDCIIVHIVIFEMVIQVSWESRLVTISWKGEKTFLRRYENMH